MSPTLHLPQGAQVWATDQEECCATRRGLAGRALPRRGGGRNVDPWGYLLLHTLWAELCQYVGVQA